MLLLVFSIRSYHINHHFSIFYLTKQIAVIIIDKDGKVGFIGFLFTEILFMNLSVYLQINSSRI